MRLFRVFPWVSDAKPGDPGHPLHVDVSRQGSGRGDNPGHYQALYLAESPQGAVGETFGDLIEWTPEMLAIPWLPDAVRGLATFEAEPPLNMLDLDNCDVLVDFNIRPSEVAGRNRERTREITLQIWLRDRWEGIRWWSWWRPEWHNQMVWAAISLTDPPWIDRLEIDNIDRLTIDHPAVQLAAEVLRRRIIS